MPYIQHKQAIVDFLYTLLNQNKNNSGLIFVLPYDVHFYTSTTLSISVYNN